MTAEPGSDELLAQVADPIEVVEPVVEETVRSTEEDERLEQITPSRREPGDAYPDPDEPPPADQPHDEYNPTP